MRERGLKPSNAPLEITFLGSLPMRERGLKQHRHNVLELDDRSLPMRERGLKLGTDAGTTPSNIIAPYAGARIETVFLVLICR